MFFKRLFQCVRYSVSLYADCAVIYQGSRKSRGRLGDRSPPPPDFGRCTNVIRITGLITPTSLLLHRKPFLFCKYFFSFLGNHIRFLFGTSKAGKTPRYCYCTFQSKKRRKYCHTSYDIFPIPRQCDWNISHVAQVIWVVRFLLEEYKIRGRSQTTLTRFWLFFDRLPPCVDIFYDVNVDKKWTFLNHLPTSSCKRSLWMTLVWNRTTYIVWKSHTTFIQVHTICIANLNVNVNFWQIAQEHFLFS